MLINHFLFNISLSNLSAFGEELVDSAVDTSNSEATHSPQSSGVSIPASPPQPSEVEEPSEPLDLIEAKPTAYLVPEHPAASSGLNLDNYNFNVEYVGWPLERVYNETKYQPGLFFKFDNTSGGVGNIRNFILTCIRYAIDSGPTGLIMPKIQRSSERTIWQTSSPPAFSL